MQFEAYYQLLARRDVKELAFQAGRPPCVLIGAEYRAVAKRSATEDEILALLSETGRAEMLRLMEGHSKWSFEHASVGTIAVSAGYHGTVLQVRLKRDDSAAAQPAARKPNGAREAASPIAGLSFEVSSDTGAEPIDANEFPAIPPAPRPRPAIRTVDEPVSHARAQLAQPPPARETPPSQARMQPVNEQPAPPSRADLQPIQTRQAPVSRADLEPAQGRPTPPSRADFQPVQTRQTPPSRADMEPVQTRQTPPSRADVPAWQKPPSQAKMAPVPVDETVPPDDANFDFIPPEYDPAAAIDGMTPAECMSYLLRLARERIASDVHVLADRAPTLRVAGDLVTIGSVLHADFVQQMLLPIVPGRVRGDLDLHGACDFALNTDDYGRFRVNVTRQRTGMKLTARPIGMHVPTLKELGLPEGIAAATHQHQGLIVVTGPTGHGKTTTLAAIVDIINSQKGHHISTVEDPIEYVHPRKMSMMSQREVGTHTKKFAAALKGSLREDPDVIVVGELRDTETVRMALSASETGHLVISTMNTPSAAKAIERLIDLFPPGDQPQVRLTLAGGLRLVVSQRLIPNADHTGMVAAAELLPGSSPLWALIRDGKTFQIPSLQQRGKALGIVRMDDSLADLVRSGRTTLETARSYAENPGDFDAVVNGKSNREGEEQLTIGNIDPTAQAARAAKDALFRGAGKLFGNDKK